MRSPNGRPSYLVVGPNPFNQTLSRVRSPFALFVDNFVNIIQARRVLNAAREGQPVSRWDILRALRVTGDLCYKKKM